MTPHGFRSTLIAAGAVAGFLTFTLHGAILGLLCVAWLGVRTAPPGRNDRILQDLADGKIRAVWKK